MTIKIPLYELEIVVIVSDKIEEVINKRIKLKKWSSIDKVEGKVYGYAVSPGNLKDYCIFYRKENLGVNTITHEVSHITDFILSERGVEDSGEAKAYLNGYINEKIFDFLFKNKLLTNKYLILEQPISKDHEE